MKRLLVFLFCTFTLTCVIAALLGNPGRWLLTVAFILLYTVWAVALCASLRNPLKGHKK